MDNGEQRPNGQAVSASTDSMRPGDQAPVGTPGTGLNVCRTCGGSGRTGRGDCTTCEGTGTVVEAVGG